MVKRPDSAKKVVYLIVGIAVIMLALQIVEGFIKYVF